VAKGNLEPAAGRSLEQEANTRRGWLLGPWLDLFLVANIAWPLLLLVQLDEGFQSRDGLQFWQVYFITTPHRWVTLLLVFLDRERFQARRGIFLIVAAGVVAICTGVRLSTGTLTCLLAVDYIWNAWHFAAQHHGIYRIYGRLAEPGRFAGLGLGLEKWALRMFLLYVIVRVAGATWSYTVLEQWLRRANWFVPLVPAGLLATDFVRTRGRALGGTIYLVSVCTLYLSLLVAVHASWPALVLSLATASALFHALEYLALVSWSVRERHAARQDRLGMLGYLASRWAMTLGVFLLVLGAGGWLMNSQLMETWLFVNVIVAFLHYAYDGLIWRRSAGVRNP